MRNNIGAVDKTIRLTVALTISLLVFSSYISGPRAVFLFLFAFGLVITCFKGNCPVYRLLGISTNRNLNDKARQYEYQRNQTLLKNYLKNYRERYSEMGNG
ncbi:MAG: DUF2892 domain-containing protein [Chitinophagaceae bacterium]|nr:DUF2892 domain-containing protein [Chitinophagaceae bacterium]